MQRALPVEVGPCHERAGEQALDAQVLREDGTEAGFVEALAPYSILGDHRPRRKRPMWPDGGDICRRPRTYINHLLDKNRPRGYDSKQVIDYATR